MIYQNPTSSLKMTVFSNNQIDIPPGQSGYEVKASKTLNAEATLFGVYPHLHLIGRSIRAKATLPDSARIPLISIADWDFNWQSYSQYGEAVRLPAGTRIDACWTNDNSASNPANPSNPPRRVTCGEQMNDEMAFLVFDRIANESVPGDAKPVKP